jgi:hypothetical protein
MASQKTRRKRAFLIPFKLKVINYYEKVKKLRKTSRKFNLTRKTVREWVKNKEKYVSCPNKRSRTRYLSKRKSICSIFENDLNAQICAIIEQCGCVTGEAIQTMAKVLASQKEEISEVKCSNGWLSSFLQRYNYSLRRVSSTVRELPSNYKDIINDFFNSNSKFSNINRSCIYNMDETSIYLDMPGT